jgi:hypothetical protein
MIKKQVLSLLLFCCYTPSFSWGFYGHKKINYQAVFLLPTEMINFYKANIDYLSEHAVDPDKRRYAVKAEGPRHYIDLDYYGEPPFLSLPRNWDDAVNACTKDSLNKYGIVPFWVEQMLFRLTNAFKHGDTKSILKLSAEIGHYVADAHVPLHANSNHNGQCTDQVGIHGFWESRVPELLADAQWDFIIGKANYLHRPNTFIWDRVLESAVASDSVLKFEKKLNDSYPADKKYAIEPRNGKNVKQYSTAYTMDYNKLLNGMVERRMRESIYAVASFWMTAWVNAGQPNLSTLLTN